MLTGQRLPLFPLVSALQDATDSLTAAELIGHPEAFTPLATRAKGNPTCTWWLRTTLRTNGLHDPGSVVSFSYLTFVDIYLYENDTLLAHKITGAFRPRSQLTDGDGRLYALLPIQPNRTYTLLLQVLHTKHYQPVFDFAISPKRQYFDELRVKQSIDSALMGAICIFFVYTLLSWIASRFRPYLWLLLFIGGIGCNVISSSGYWIEWFSPEHPAAAWMLNMQFLYLGLLGMYLLLVDFWRIRSEFPKLYAWVRWVPALLAARALSAFTIEYFTGNYWLAGLIDRTSHPIMMVSVIAVLYTCWPRLNSARRYLAAGLILFSICGIYLTIYALLGKERSLASVSIIGYSVILLVFLLFATGLKEEMRQHELAKLAALEELNRLQRHQKSILEKLVEERTEALRVSNKRLQNQKYQLGERNTKIELLINELNHRVKNNLQMLYSLLSLQLPIVRDGVSREILKGNIGKIRAMMLVNEKLFNFEKGSNISFCEFITELALHHQKIYDSKERTRIQQDIPAGIQLSDKQTLSFGLILSELFTNTFKHAFRDHPDPWIRVKAVALSPHLLEFSYADNGVGIPAGETAERFTMGIPLIKDLTRQMNGQMEIDGEKGLSYSFTIPV